MAFATQAAVAGGYTGGHGGETGRVIGNAMLTILDKVPSAMLFFVLALLAFFFAFGISPQVILKLKGLFKRSEADTDLAELKQKAGDSGFQLNEGVPVEHFGKRQGARLSTFKNTAQKLSGTENREALTVASDPDWKFPSIDLLNQKQDKANSLGT